MTFELPPQGPVFLEDGADEEPARPTADPRVPHRDDDTEEDD